MTIGIDVSPLESGHKIRGVGFYLSNLTKSLLEKFPQNEYIFFTQKKPLDVNVDVVHYPYFDPFFLTLPSNNKHKTVVTVHDLTPVVFPEHFPAGIKGNIKWHFQKHNLKKAQAIIADSFASKKDIVKIVGLDEDRVHVVHLAAARHFKVLEDNQLRINNILSKYNLPEKFALYVGDVTWNKNVPRIVKAAIKANIPLVMVGKTLATENFDIKNPWNKDLVEFKKLTEGITTIHKLGFVSDEDLVSIYNLASVFVFPSLYEGFGLPVLEAMQSGCPVVTTKNGSLGEITDDAAYIVDAYDSESIAMGISDVFHNNQLQIELTTKGLAQAKKFTWSKTAQDTIKVYKNV